MIGQFSEEPLKTSSEAEESDESANNMVDESNSFEDDTPLYDAPYTETQLNDDKTDDEVINVPIADDVPAWHSESPLNFRDDVEENKIPDLGEVVKEPYIKADAEDPTTLLKTEDSERFRTRWNEIQGSFVDEPRAAVQQADELVSEVVELITQMFAAERNILEGQWKQGNDVSTEDLRKALQHYRSFFKRLVT